MFRRHMVAGAICAVVTALAGCASAASTGAGAGTGGGTSGGSGGCAAKTVTITTANNGKTLCVTAGTAITVLLHSPSGNKWQQVKSSSTVLTQQPGPGAQAGMTGAAFVAARPGKAVLSSDRFACHSNLGAHCGAIVAFHTTVVVQGP